MDKTEWKKRYKARLIERGFDEQFAQETTDAVDINNYDTHSDNPEDSADEELSYWND